MQAISAIPKHWLILTEYRTLLKLGFAVKYAWETNRLEENESELSVENDSIRLNLKPDQIMTIRLKESAWS